MIDLVREPFTLLDGGLSTALEEMGERPAGPLWTAAALVDRPEVITAAHRRYVDAGADIVITASYQASEAGFMDAGLTGESARRVLASTTEVARASGAPLVASSVGPFGACLGDGSEYHGRYAASWAEVRRFHRSRLEVLVESGPDLFAIETMPTAAEAEIVVEELRALSGAPAWLSFTCVDEVHTAGGDVFADAADSLAADVSAVGVNCTSPALALPLLAAVRSTVPLVVYTNHGATWDGDHSCWRGAVGGVELPALVPSWLAVGARLIGGCCGVGTEGIAALGALRHSLT